MVKFEGENGIKIAQLLSAMREDYGFTYKQSVDYFVKAITDKRVIEQIDYVLSQEATEK